MNENNYYHQHKQEISDICDKKGVDLGVAVSMYQHENAGLLADVPSTDAEEFLDAIRDMTGKEVAKYFNEP